jgi:hypothetical protein
MQRVLVGIWVDRLAHCWHTAELAGELVSEVLFLYHWRANALNFVVWYVKSTLFSNCKP